VTSATTKRFRTLFADLPAEVQEQAQSKFSMWLDDPQHPSLHFKKVSPNEPVWPVRINRSYRALGIREKNHIEWFWIGGHDEYERMLSPPVKGVKSEQEAGVFFLLT